MKNNTDETMALNHTLFLLNEEGLEKAYDYLKDSFLKIKSPSSQIYNYLSCISAILERKEEAIGWLEEAIEKKEYFYRPEVFKDDDYANIKEDKTFKKLANISYERYMKALKNTKTIFTWENKRKDNIIISLHGNQENLNFAKEKWGFLEKNKYQTEYLQSSAIDSYNLYRWEDEGDGYLELAKSIDKIPWDSYKKHILAGFSAGCNVILKAICKTNISTDQIILVSPWIPSIEKEIESITEALVEKNIDVILICGSCDEDCFLPTKKLYDNYIKKGKRIRKIIIDDLEHEFPKNFEEIILKHIFF